MSREAQPAYLRQGQWLSRLWLAAGFVFLYLPIVALVVYSFNASSLPTQWGGFTLAWFSKLADDAEVLDGLWLSLKIAFCSATAAVVLGTLAALSLVRYKRFTGRTAMVGMINAPLVMPEVIIGLSLLLMLVSLQRWLGFPERGMLTIWLAHLLVGMAYATVVIQARLQGLNPQLEEAALNLGARPVQVFFLVTLPMIAQSLMSAWLLTFTLSLDDVVLAAFLSGPGSTTLPLVIFSRARLGLDPSVNAVATVVIAVVSVAVIGGSYALARAERRRQQEVAQAAHS
ncbi:MAG TPA: ABC transporter permease subunit [Aquabacterium sp.]|uniref:ABC transporter permease subunit n=1 Tax=Aquabacterium sp. TaxID=1872578 RepID=UPI002E3811D7|nr:ABC transporter permease subunit [Aquabacterium sp.]HEX5371949.1 ABC transporter permease subunit [Aquabacterium sp.]